ncbi:hypothetical protein PENTCL1PPCAC_28009 [Pristionchus entomophagus]|uniref:Uncharacterized protein n=1 Tax=Pristionchus entomophagus TaxID=358040 RepID=A0AAV5UJ12_9BILA|nr:hypothetical protein PENTCL1PPCAC_28009 [Pristionchus entomophagus]
MDQFDLTSVVNDLQRLIYSTRETTVEDNAIQTAHTLRNAFQRATAEFVRPAMSGGNGQKKNGQVLDQQLRLLRLENRALQNELENIAATTAHVQQSHRATMQAVLRGEVPSQERGGGWERHPLEQLLVTDARKCEVAEHTPSEEQEHLRVFAYAVKQIVRDAESKFFGQRDMSERVAFENFVMRNLLGNRGEKVDYQELVRSFREVTPTDVSKDDAAAVSEFTHEDVMKASQHFEDEFWAEHEKDRVEMEDRAVVEEEKRKKPNVTGSWAARMTLQDFEKTPSSPRSLFIGTLEEDDLPLNEEQSRKDQDREDGASVVEGLLRQYQKK